MGLNARIDQIERVLCRVGVLPIATWESAQKSDTRKLYAGALYRGLPQYHTHIGITPFVFSMRNIKHDLRDPFPIPDNSIETFQSEDVFEHIPYAELAPIIEEIFRILKPGGLFRLSVPDYRCDVMLDRSIKNEAGAPIFDPGGGGAFVNGKVVNDGHLWFPNYERVKSLLENSAFATLGIIRFLHYTSVSGESVLEPIDYSLGYVQRTPDNDDRVRSPRRAMSIVVDCTKMYAER
jgi:SAM-dependent methyltransferase